MVFPSMITVKSNAPDISPQRVKRGRLLPVSAVFRSGETGSIRTAAQNRPTRRTLPFRRAVRNEAAPGNRHAAERLAQNTREPAGPPNRKARQAQRRNIHGQPVEPKRSGCRRAQTQRRGRIGRCGPSVASAPRRTISRRACAPSRQAGFSAAASPWASPPHTHPP